MNMHDTFLYTFSFSFRRPSISIRTVDRIPIVEMHKTDVGWSGPTSTFVIIHVSLFVLSKSVSPTDSGVLQKQRSDTSGQGDQDPSIQWNAFLGCVQCLCKQEMGLIDCSGKTMSRGRLPSAGSLPRNDVVTL
jgi:hypothetical protein